MSNNSPVSVLATDMDGTFIPLDGNDENRHDLVRLCDEIDRHGIELVYVTGRHYALVIDAVTSHSLPAPQWLICDVGTSIYRKSGADRHELSEDYHRHLGEIVQGFSVAMLAEQLVELDSLRLQEPEKQGPFKLSYYCDAADLEGIATQVAESVQRSQAPYRIIASVDPFTGDGLIDLLPDRVSKDYALRWWVGRTERSDRSVVFAGDSGNDLAALTAGYRSIVVANAEEAIADQARRAHQSSGWTDRLFIANKPATSGVLEGLQHFLASTDRDGD